MSEPLNANAGDGLGAAEEAVRPSEPQTVAGTLTAADDSVGEAGAEGDSFPASYVRELRQENAENRVKAQENLARADAAVDALFQSCRELATAGILYHPADLPNGDYAGENGLPDVEKMREAALALAQERPHLARARGSVGQGPRGHTSDGFTLAGALRDAAR